jgi:hypothetical protein
MDIGSNVVEHKSSLVAKCLLLDFVPGHWVQNEGNKVASLIQLSLH